MSGFWSSLELRHSVGRNKLRAVPAEVQMQRRVTLLNMPTAEFIETYLEADDEDGPYKARQRPCPFLGDDDRCTIYEVRPTVCREYPHTDKEGFTFRTMGVASNAQVCPAVFWIVEQMKQRALN